MTSTFTFKVFGTVALALGFVLFMSKAPFVPDLGGQEQSATERDALPRILASGNARASAGVSGIAVPAGFEPPAGLYKARFGASSDMPSFATEEHLVAGACEGAGERWFRETCPTCSPLVSEARDGVPALLVWTESQGGANVMHAVTADCAAVGEDGAPMIATLTFDDRQDANLAAAADGTPSAVPLLPGATRTASIEVGAWLATFDRVGRPSTALADMVRLLGARGWREIPEGRKLDARQFEGDRVLTNDDDDTCVLSLTRQDDGHQLLTIISPGRG